MENEGVQYPKVTQEGYIPMSERFERDLDTETVSQRRDNITFDEDSNVHFVYDDMNELIGTAGGLDTLANMVRTFYGAQRERLDVLEDYSKGENTAILTGKRRIEDNKADKRVRHAFGGYISGFITGFIAGKPITLGSEIKDSDDLQDLEQMHTVNDINTLNYDLMYDASRYGRAFELHMRQDGDNEDRVYLINPKEMFVIRSADVTQRIIGAVHCPIYNGKVHLTVYTDDAQYTYEPFMPNGIHFTMQDARKHFYGMVPVVEWWGNRYRIGDFEPVISLIDAYDSAQSDTSNYMTDLNDAMLVIKGDIKGAGYTPSDFKDMADANILVLESAILANGGESPLDAGYIYKQYDVEGTEAHKERLKQDIHMLTNVPNLKDDSFGTASGIAIQYKLVGLRQIQATKESYFKKALRRRYKLIENIHAYLNDVKISSQDLTFTFHPNLPEDIWSEIKAYIDAGGDLSQETLQEIASFVDSATEKQRLDDERMEAITQGLTLPRIATPAPEDVSEDAE